MARRLRKPFMPWQRDVADVVLEIDPATGELAYSEFIITVPRQSGKSTWVLAKSTHRCSATKFFGPRQHLIYTAQTRNKAREKFREDYAVELGASTAFGPSVRAFWQTGDEHLRFKNGSKFGIEANTEKAGHGSTLDEAYIDEAFAQADNRLEQAFRPAMITRRNTQLGTISTAGWSDGSPYLQGKVAKGRENVEADIRRGIAYFEWSAPEGSDPGDPEVWRACMPALGHTITESDIAAEYQAMDLHDFKRAYLNMWVPKSSAAEWQIIEREDWARAQDPASTVLDPVVLSVEIAHDRLSAVIGVAGRREDDRWHVEVAEQRDGTEWLLARVVAMWDAHSPSAVVVDDKGPAGALIPDLQAAGVFVLVPGARDLTAAYSRFVDACRPEHDRIRHRGQTELTSALAGAGTRKVGDQITWERKLPGVAPAVACSLALWGHLSGAGRPFFASWR